MNDAPDMAACRRAVAAARAAGRRIGLVPTMGGLHVGHASLIERSRTAGDFVAVSIYVNPTQFGPSEDFRAYPRPLEADRGIAAAAGCDLLFLPSHDEMYRPDDETRVRPGRLADALCGPFRPGHFEGVCTVVAKLFNIVQPDVAYFGQKDAQQARVIRAMTDDLKLPVRIDVCPIIREPDGLACSTRNQYLSAEDRVRAASLHRALCAGRDRIAGGEPRAGVVIAGMRRVFDEAGITQIDYISIVDPDTLADLAVVAGPALLAVAVRLGSARLIDNMLFDGPA